MTTEIWKQSVNLALAPALQNELSQIGARATLTALGADADPSWRYRTLRVLRNITAIQESLLNLAAAEVQLVDSEQDAARSVARAWENFADLDEGVPRSTALLNAAVAYELAGYQANSACLARLAVPESAWTAEPQIDGAVSAFLQRKFLRVQSVAHQLLVPPGEAARLDVDELQRQAAQAVFALSLSEAAAYFLTGSEERMTTALTHMDLAVDGFAEIGDAVLANAAVSMTKLLPTMVGRSTWSLLEGISDSARWQRYLRVLARGLGPSVVDSRSISELWPSQRAAVDGGLLRSDDSLVVRMPTSAGKTRIAELAMVHTLVSQPGAKCVYVAPYRALVNEIEDAFSNLFLDLGYAANAVPGSYEQDELGQLIATADDVLVLTPEKLDLLFRLQPELLESVRLVVVDEGHIVGDRERGAKFELLISRLRRRLPDARFIMVSAVVPDRTLREFAEWIGGEQPASITSSWRPSLLRHAKLEWSGSQGTLRYAGGETDALFVPSAIRQRTYEHIFAETGRVRRPRFPDPGSKSEIAGEIAYVYAEQGPVLIFAMQTDWAESIARAVMRRVALTELVGNAAHAAFRHRADSRAATVATEWLGAEHEISRLLARGIAFHHARLPTAVREAIEEDFRSQRLSVLVATSTLAQGVNLPIRTAVFHSTRSQEADGTPRILSSRDYWNIAGRAGRAGHETTGTAIHIVRNSMDDRDFRRYAARRDQVEWVESALHAMLRDLVADRISGEEAASQLDSDLLALLVEEDEAALDSAMLGDTLATSLFSIQAAESRTPVRKLYEVMTSSATRIVETVPSAERRRLYASTGLSSSSCRILSAHAQDPKNRTREILETSTRANVDALVVRRGFGDRGECCASSFDFGGDLFCCFVPDERFGVVVPVFDPQVDRVGEGPDAVERTAA